MRKLQPWWKIRGLQHIELRGDNSHIEPFYRQYYPGCVNNKVTEDTIFWHAAGRYSPKRQLAGIFLRGVIDPYIQKHTYEALHAMRWRLPKRKECIPAIKLQGKRGIPPGEWAIGASGSVIENATAEHQLLYIRHLEPLLKQMDKVFKTVLPTEHYAQNIPLPRELREQIAAQKKGTRPVMGGIPARYRLFLTCFSSIALLRNCPTAIHRDYYNARQDEINFSCITTVGTYKGGSFCLPAYELRVPVGPGDLLICQTNREYHCNIGRVSGEKYSIVCYYKTRVAQPNVAIGKSMRLRGETEEQKALDWVFERTHKLNRESEERVKKQTVERLTRNNELLTPEQIELLTKAFAKAGYLVVSK